MMKGNTKQNNGGSGKEAAVYRLLPWWRLLCLSLFFGLAACELEDPRDACCNSNMVQYKFLYFNSDCFAERVNSMRYFLFRGSGKEAAYMGELQSWGGDISRCSLLGLEAGVYTLVALGNMEDYGTLLGLEAGDSLGGFCLTVSHLFEGEPAADAAYAFANGDRLYWNLTELAIEAGAQNNFTAYLSHIHCSLHLRVEWELLPGHTSGYRFELQGVGQAVDLHADSVLLIASQPFPRVHGYAASMMTEVTLHNFCLEEQLITLRYAAGNIPVFSLWNNDEKVTADIDLGRVFEEWGWDPDRVAVQEYEIRMLIRADGSVEVKQGFEAGVADWIDGGVIGG